jgi:uncharacterized Rmd1/YagE family protein
VAAYKVISYQVADSIDIKTLKPAFKAHLHYSDADELFFETGSQRYVSLFKYGVVSFFNYNEVDISAFLQFVTPFSRNRFSEDLTDEFIIESGAAETKVNYNKIDIRTLDKDVLRLIMMNVSQSVALDYSLQQTTTLLEETNEHTKKLEKKGRLDISGTNLKKFIGKTLLLKNRIAENLYIFDSPPETWEDEKLDKLHNELKKNLDLQDRFRSVSEGLGIVKENLELFKDILQYRNSVLLEWIVIALIAVEVLHFLLEELFKK